MSRNWGIIFRMTRPTESDRQHGDRNGDDDLDNGTPVRNAMKIAADHADRRSRP